jgi:hypothetical protein
LAAPRPTSDGGSGGATQTLTPVAANEQLYVSYGDKTNSELALDYGFVDAQDLAGSYLLTLTIPPEDVFFDDKVLWRSPRAPPFSL